jgi:[ribosomal protein S18]-alanine N-acetyltransferase
MAEAEAQEIAAWRYEDPYSFYDSDADADDLAELLAAKSRDDQYFAAFREDELIGFFQFKLDGDDIVIGLGLRPDLTGRGLGLSFTQAGMAFARERFRRSRFRLSVATFNERAIRVYERAGFRPLRTYDHETAGAVHTFLEMVTDSDLVLRSRPSAGRRSQA